ncbi:desampylase [Haloarchaeobius amylolyticus]|uniref:desampylase n=1 Tax=Haloarchaeobius amylolyticus TaxID=1198296 RepID=UPI00226F2060|nr:desampylase [Haloarchaeobius amylolyticus]
MGDSYLHLPADCRGHLLAHARAVAPEESCGVLGGTEDSDGDWTVTSVHAVTNVADTPRTRYELDPEETYRVVEALEDADDDVVGFYHSHPTGPDGPSATDRTQATWEGKVYCIVSLGGETENESSEPEPDGEARIGAWVWTGEAFEPVELS